MVQNYLLVVFVAVHIGLTVWHLNEEEIPSMRGPRDRAGDRGSGPLEISRAIGFYINKQ